MKTDVKGCSTTALEQENYEEFSSRLFGSIKWSVQYDYRHINGELFSCVAPSLDECREKRDNWLNSK